MYFYIITAFFFFVMDFRYTGIPYNTNNAQPGRYLMKKGVLFFIAACICMFQTVPLSSHAGEVDVLINRLVEKGIIEQSDAADILKDVHAAAAQQRKQMVTDTAAALQQDIPGFFDIPSWVQRTQLTGHLRLRYQLNDRKGRNDIHRARYRLRLGFITEITDRINVGFGLVTGNRDPRTTNVTIGRSFDSPGIWLDYAYASYAPFDWLTLTGGKIINPLWLSSDWLWDGDIRPEGISAAAKYDFNPMVNVFFNSSFFVIDHWSESNDVRRAKQDPYMYILQPGFNIKPVDDVYIKGAFTYYGFGNVRKNFGSAYSARTNTRWGNSRWLNDDFDAITTSLEVGFCNMLDPIPFIAVFGDFVNNITKSSNNKGFIAGVKLGEKSFSKQGQWQVEANWRRLDENAWLDLLTDSTTYGGETGIRGWQIKTAYGFFDNVVGRMTYFSMEKTRGGKRHENNFLADILFLF